MDEKVKKLKKFEEFLERSRDENQDEFKEV